MVNSRTTNQINYTATVKFLVVVVAESVPIHLSLRLGVVSRSYVLILGIISTKIPIKSKLDF